MELRGNIYFWLNHVLMEDVPEAVEGFYFGLYREEGEWKLRLIGSEVFDKNPVRWTAKMIFKPEEILSWKQDTDRERLLEEIAEYIEFYMELGHMKHELADRQGLAIVDDEGHFRIVCEKEKKEVKRKITVKEDNFFVRPPKVNWGYAAILFALLCLALLFCNYWGMIEGKMTELCVGVAALMLIFFARPLPGFQELYVEGDVMVYTRCWFFKKEFCVQDINLIQHRLNGAFYEICGKKKHKKISVWLEKDYENIDKLLKYMLTRGDIRIEC